jgi:hypothetical protein
VRIDPSLKEWALRFAESRKVTVSSLVRDYFSHLRAVHGDGDTSEVGVEQI